MIDVAELAPMRWPATIAVMRQDDLEQFHEEVRIPRLLVLAMRFDQEAWIWTYRVWSGWRPRCVHCGIDLTMQTATRFGQFALLCILADECRENAEWPWFGSWRARANAAVDALERRFGGLG